MVAKRAEEKRLVPRDYYRTKTPTTIRPSNRRKRIGFLTFLVAYVCTEAIAPVYSMSIKPQEDISYLINVTDSTGSAEFSHCLNYVKNQISDLAGPKEHPFHSDFQESVHGVNFTCTWLFNIEPLDTTIEFKIVHVDLPQCSEPSLGLRFKSPSSNPGSRLITKSSNSLSTGDFFFFRASDLRVIYRQSTACPVDTSHGFHIKFRNPLHLRQRRDVSPTVSNNQRQKDSQQITSTSTISQQPMNFQATHKPLNPTTPQREDDSGSSDDGWKIAVGVAIPLLIVIIILVTGYKIYRKKFPVRMILGRQFSTFRNPHYQRPTSGLTLVRDDFDLDRMAHRNSTEYNPDYQTSDLKIPYHNKGFEDDEIDLNDESTEERNFRLRKSWLFRNKEDQGEKQNSSSEEGVGESSASVHEGDGDEVDGRKNRKGDGGEKEYSDDSDVEAMLQEQKVTPRLPRKNNISETDSSTSSTLSEPVTRRETDVTKSDHSYSLKTNESSENINTNGVVERKSSFVEMVKPLFQLPTTDEVRAQLKARARSTSGSKCQKPDRPRSFSLQIDPSKSARRGSGSWTESSTAESDLRRFAQIQNVTASVVGVAYLSASVRAMYSSLSSVSSNPHLVTDLDEELSDCSGSLGRSKRSDIGVGGDDGDSEERPENIHTEYSHDGKQNSGEKDEKGGTLNEFSKKTVIFQHEPVYLDNSDRETSGSDSRTQSELELDRKDKDKNDDIDSDNGVESRKSTSGSSSSSDTHVEDHPAKMTKPQYTPQISTLSALSDPGSAGVQEPPGQYVFQDAARLESVDDTLDGSSHMDEGQEGRDGHDRLASNSSNVNDFDHDTEHRREDETIKQSLVVTNMIPDSVELTSSTETCHQPETTDHELESFDGNKVDDVEWEGDFKYEDDNLPQSAGDQDCDETISEVAPQYCVENDKTEGCDQNERAPSDADDHDISLDLNRDSGAQDLHRIEHECEKDNIKANRKDDGSIEAGEDDNMKKNILNDDGNNNACVDNDDDDNDDEDFKHSDSLSDTDSDSDRTSSSDSGMDAIGSYSFQLSASGENSIDEVSGQAEKNEPSDKVVDSALEDPPSDKSSHKSRKVDIISKVHLSDASSDSSDILEDEDESMSSIQNKSKHSLAHFNTNPSMKKISFNLSNLNNDSDDDDDDESVVDSDDDAINNDENDRETLRDGLQNNKLIPETDNYKLTVTHQHVKHDSAETRHHSLSSPEPPKAENYARKDSDSEGLNVYNEFSDDAIDTILTESDGVVVKSIDVADSNSNMRTTQRTIGVDPDVKFSFDWKTQVMDGSDDDDIDV